MPCFVQRACCETSYVTIRLDASSLRPPWEAQLEDHLRLEEGVILPAVRELLSRETQTSIIDELRLRRQNGRPQQGPTSSTIREDES